QPASFTTEAVDGLFTATDRVTPAPMTVPDGLIRQANVPLNVANPTPPILSVVATPTPSFLAGTDRGSTTNLVPGLWPRTPGRKNGSGAVLEGDRARERPEALPPAVDAADELLWQRASAAWFATDSGAADVGDTATILPGNTAPATSAAAVAALA